MNHEPTNRIRSTSVRRGDRRAAGFYEQCVELPEASTHTSVARKVGVVGGLSVSGLVDRTAHLDVATLRRLAGGDGIAAFDEAFVEFFDLMAHVRPARGARVVVFEGVDGRIVACRLDALLIDPTLRLELGSTTRPMTGEDASGGSHDPAAAPRRNWRLPVRIDAPQQPAIHDLEIASIHVTMGDHPFGFGA